MLLGVLNLSLLEQNQAEVGVEDEDVGVLLGQPAIDHFRLGIRVGLEVDEAEEIENVRVIGTQFLRALQLPSRLGVPAFLKRLASAVVVEEKNTLIEG